jgi:tRNA U38,U39,U40 pseudouridine synthase TruA
MRYVRWIMCFLQEDVRKMMQSIQNSTEGDGSVSEVQENFVSLKMERLKVTCDV